MSKINVAGRLISEDHLKWFIGKNNGKPFKTADNKLLPRAQHSAFGDFPSDYMKKTSKAPEPLKPMDTQQLSAAATKT